MTTYNCMDCSKELYYKNKPHTEIRCRNCRLKIYYKERTLKRKKQKEEHLCINCNHPVEPIVKYPVRCNSCINKIKNYNQLNKRRFSDGKRDDRRTNENVL